jgi:hypothetical protein
MIEGAVPASSSPPTANRYRAVVPEGGRSIGICFKYRDSGECPYGPTCTFPSHLLPRFIHILFLFPPYGFGNDTE